MNPVRQLDTRTDLDDDVALRIAPEYGGGDVENRASASEIAGHNPFSLATGTVEQGSASTQRVASIPSPNRQADKIKSLLASYYDVEGEAEVEEIQPAGANDVVSGNLGRHVDGVASTRLPMGKGTETSPSPPPSPPSGADLLAQIKSNQRLDDLLTTERELATDIGNADIELRGVVYDSYCSFIKASETVHNLHVALHDVDASLHRLDTLLTSVAENSESIDRRLNKQQQIIFEMHEKRSVAQGVEALLKVDERIREELDAGDYEQVVRLYRASTDALEAYKCHETVAFVREKVAVLRQRAVEELDRRMAADRKDRSVLGMLVGLGEARERLIGDYLELVRSDLSSLQASDGERPSKDAEPHGPGAGEQDAAWGVVLEALAVCREVVSSRFKDSNGVTSTDDVDCVRMVDAFVVDSVHDIASCAVDRAMETVIGALAAAGGFDVSGAGCLDSEEHQYREMYGHSLPAMFETLDATIRHAGEVDAACTSMHTANTTEEQENKEGYRSKNNLSAIAVVQRIIAGALGRHVFASYAVVGARAFKAIKEMMMRLLLTEEEDARFLRILIKSLEVSAKQDFGLVEKTIEAWVSWDGFVSKLQVLESLDSSCQSMLAKLCDSVMGIVTSEGELGSPAMSPSMASASLSAMTLPEFLQKQFSVPATLSKMDKKDPVAILCLASSLTVVRSAVVDAEMKETVVPATVDGLTSRYIDRLTTETMNVVESSFPKDVLGQTATPPSAPSKTAIDVIRLVMQAKTDCASTNWPETTWPRKLLTIAIAQEMTIADRSKPISKAAFQQLQVDVAVMKKQLSPDLGDALEGIVSRVAESCGEPALVDPLTLARLL